MEFSEAVARDFIEKHKPELDRVRKKIFNFVSLEQAKYYLEKLSAMADEIKEAGENDDFLSVEAAGSADRMMTMDAYMSTLVVSYGRLFTESEGAQVFKTKLVPEEHKQAHDELMMLRHKRFAHHGGHGTTAAELGVDVFEDEVVLDLKWSHSIEFESFERWGALIKWLEEFLHDSFKKYLNHLSKTTGKEWRDFAPVMKLSHVTMGVEQ